MNKTIEISEYRPRFTPTQLKAINEAFPAVEPYFSVLGSRVLVQLRSPKTVTKGGILLVEDTIETERDNEQVALVIEIGPLAFKNPDTLEPWPEGPWFKPGDFIRVPKYNGDRWKQAAPNGAEVVFATFSHKDPLGILKPGKDPLEIKAFV